MSLLAAAVVAREAVVAPAVLAVIVFNAFMAFIAFIVSMAFAREGAFSGSTTYEREVALGKQDLTNNGYRGIQC